MRSVAGITGFFLFCVTITHWLTPANSATTCLDDFTGATVEQLNACLTELRSEIAEIKNKPTQESQNTLLTAGTFKESTNQQVEVGTLSVAWEKNDPGKFRGQFAQTQLKEPLVAIGSLSDSAIVTVEGVNKTAVVVKCQAYPPPANPANCNFWYFIYRAP